MKTYFQIARPIWGKGHEDELNSSLFFVVALPNKAKTLRIAGCSFYRASLDGVYFAMVLAVTPMPITASILGR